MRTTLTALTIALAGCCSHGTLPEDSGALASSYERYMAQVGGARHATLKASKLDEEDKALKAREAAAALLIAKTRKIAGVAK